MHGAHRGICCLRGLYFAWRVREKLFCPGVTVVAIWNRREENERMETSKADQ